MTARQYAMFKWIERRGFISKEIARTLRQRTLGSLVTNGWVGINYHFEFFATDKGASQADSVTELHRGRNSTAWSTLMPVRLLSSERTAYRSRIHKVA